MPERFTTDFAFLAFNSVSGTLLAHGKTAAHAALKADQVAPEATIKIMPAGLAGIEIWKARMTQWEAGVILEKENEPYPFDVQCRYDSNRQPLSKKLH